MPLVGLIAYLERKGRRDGKLGRVVVSSPSIEEDDEQPEPTIQALHVPDKNLLR